jgi:Flp pilus assembly protein CpaB
LKPNLNIDSTAFGEISLVGASAPERTRKVGMKIKRRYMVAALVLGLMLGYCIQEYVFFLSHGVIPVVVAGADISAGTVLRPENLQVVQWSREYLPTHTAEKVKQVEGRVITQPVTKGEPVLLPKLAQPIMKEVI